MTSMPGLVALLVLTFALALGAVAARAEDVIYVPAGFPSVCAQSLTNGVSYCPDGVSGEAAAFCSESLPNLKLWVSQKGLPFCGAQGSGGTGFDQVLLVDDRNLPGSLSRLLEPIARDGRVFEKSGPFRDEDRVIRSVWIVGEGGGSRPGDDVGRPSGSGGSGGEGTDTGDSGASRTGGTSGGSSGTGGGGSSGTGGTSGGSSGTGAASQQDTGSDGPVSGDNAEQRNNESSGTSECRPGDQEYFEDIERFTVEFRKDYLPFRTLVGQALSRYMVTSRAHQFAGASPLLREYHAKMVRNRVAEGVSVPITAQIKRRRCDRRVESVEFSGLPQESGG
jgi:hypothetical protein